MRHALVAAGFILASSPAAAQSLLSDWKLVLVQRIWDRAPHNAFTDLIRFRDRWYCTFREGTDHVRPAPAQSACSPGMTPAGPRPD